MIKSEKTDKNEHFFQISLKDYINTILLDNEKLIKDINVNTSIYIFTTKRIIMFKEECFCTDSNKIHSYFYNKISSVKYDSHFVNSKKNSVLELSFSDSDENLILDFPESFLFDITSIIDSSY